MKKIPEEESAATPPASFAETFSLADSYDMVLMIFGSIGSIVTGVLLPISNAIFGRIMDRLNSDPGSFQDAINSLCLTFVYLGCIMMVSGYMQVAFWTTAGERQAQRFREKYVLAIMSQEVGWFDSVGASSLSTKVAELVGKIQDGLGRKFGDFLFNIVQFLASLIVSFYLSWKLSLVLLAAIPFVVGAGYFLVVTVTAAQQQALDQYAAAGGLATQTLNAIRTVNALNVQPSIISKYRQYLYDAMIVGLRKGVNVGIGNGVLYGVLFLTNGLCYWYGGVLVANSAERNCTSNSCVTGGDVQAVFFCLIMGSMALGQAVPPFTAFTTAQSAVGYILEVIRREPLINSVSTEGEKPDVKLRGDIEISDLEFAYPTRPNLMVCNNYSLRINAGETVALVGPSGCGKSTVINLLLRFYDPVRGSISLGGYNIRDLNIRWLRAQLGYVGQEPVLFAGSIAENIAFGLGDDGALASQLSSKKQTDVHSSQPSTMSTEELMARVIEAAKMANAHDFILGLPHGYDTDVGSNGMLLSGGQKQRIAIARALIKRPAVLLLDEATSALDAASERVVQESIDALAQSKSQTIIIIAHRLSTIRNADKICVISGGRIAEMGRHDELYASNGLYADLVRIQMGDDHGAVPSTVASPTKAEVQGVQTALKTDAKTLSSSHPDAVDLEEAKNETTEVVQPVTEVSETRSKDLNKRIWDLVFRYPQWFLVGFSGAMVSGAVFPIWGYLLSVTQKNFYLSDPDDIRDEASRFGQFFILFAVASFITSILEYGGLLGMGEKISIYLRSEMFESLLRREMAFFDQETNSVGTLTTALADDCRLLNKAFSESFARQMQAVGNLILSLVLSLYASWKISLIILATFPLVVASSAVQMQAVTASQYEDVSETSQDKVVSTQQGSPTKTVGKTDTASSPDQRQLAVEAPTLGASGSPGAILSTAFVHIRTVSAFSMHHHLAQQYATMTRERCQGRIQRSVYGGLGFGGSNAVQMYIYALLFWYGSKLMREENLSFEKLLISILCLMLGALGLGQALSDLGDQKSAYLAADRIFRCIDEGKASPIDGISTRGLTPSSQFEERGNRRGRIELRDVTFRYPTRQSIPVCSNYNLTIEPGETVALVGPSGSGKSTIINLLLRFYDPLEGQIMMDGVDIRELNIRWLRGQIGYVGQEPVLFPGSVADNIARGRNSHIDEPLWTLEQAIADVESAPGHEHALLKALAPCWPLKQLMSGTVSAVDASPSDGDIELGHGRGEHSRVADDVLAASAAAHAHDFIQTFPKGYQTDVGEGSIMVSGGQKQRIAIARALVKQPTVLLLDEATSALDANSERLVQQSIDALTQQNSNIRPTTIIVAHRLSTIRNADKICVINKGEIVEMGKHDDLLLRPDGLYRQLWEKQQGSTPVPSPARP